MFDPVINLILDNPASTIMGFLASFFLVLYFIFARPLTIWYDKTFKSTRDKQE